MGASFMSIINIFETKKCKCKNPKRILCTRFCGVCFKILSLHKNCIKILPKKFYKKLDKSLTGKDRTRELARIRDKHTCQKCGKIWQEGQRRFDVHHLNGKCGEMSKEYDKQVYQISRLSREEEIKLAILFGTAEELIRIVQGS